MQGQEQGKATVNEEVPGYNIWNLLSSFNLEMCIHNSTRYSGFLKRPEILETVYSVEEKDGEEGEKVKEKENEEVEKEETLNENGLAAEEEEEKNSDEKVPRRESETTEWASCNTFFQKL